MPPDLLPESLTSDGSASSVLNGLIPEPTLLCPFARICLQLAALLDADCLAVMKMEELLFFASFYPAPAFLATVPPCFLELEEPPLRFSPAWLGICLDWF